MTNKHCQKSIWKCILCISLLGALLFTLNIAMAAESGKCGDNLTWTLSDDGLLTISGAGDMWDDISSDQWKSSVSKVIMELGVTSISNSAFDGCKKLTSVSLPDSIVSIGYDAFKDCNLVSITIPDSVANIGINPFRGASLLKINVSPDHPSLATIDGVLFRKTDRSLVTYPKGKTESEYPIPFGIVVI